MTPTNAAVNASAVKVVPEVAALWNEHSRAWWRELNRVCKQRADRVLSGSATSGKGGVLLYQWELQKRGRLASAFRGRPGDAVERAWAFEYVEAMRELAPRYGFGFVDEKPLTLRSRREQSGWRAT